MRTENDTLLHTLLFVMIRFVVKNCHCAINLLCYKQTYHLMRECHGRKRNLFMGRRINAW